MEVEEKDDVQSETSACSRHSALNEKFYHRFGHFLLRGIFNADVWLEIEHQCACHACKFDLVPCIVLKASIPEGEGGSLETAAANWWL